MGINEEHGSAAVELLVEQLQEAFGVLVAGTVYFKNFFAVSNEAQAGIN
jgi:hypothetical protein